MAGRYDNVTTIPPATALALERVEDALRLFLRNLNEPCHTSAYASGWALDNELRALLAIPSRSDYGHAGALITIFANALEKT